MKINKTLQKKWYDFTHPTKIEHYGYSFSESDMRQFPEGRVELCNIAKTRLSMKRIKRMTRPLIKCFHNTMDKLVLDCMSVN